MATEANVVSRVERLIEDGKIYWSQPTSNMALVLTEQFKKWYTTYPSGERVPWGQGSNETLEFALSIAQTKLYGCNISSDWVNSHTRGDLEYLLRVMRMSRVSGPYEISPRDTWDWLLKRRLEGLAPLGEMDSRDIWRQVEFCKLIPDATAVELQRMSWLSPMDPLPPLEGRELVEYMLILDRVWCELIHLRLRMAGSPDVRFDELESLRPAGYKQTVLCLVYTGMPWSAAVESAKMGQIFTDSIPRPTGWVHLRKASYPVHTLDGVVVPKSLIDAPERQWLEDIQRETHQEIRRLRIERFAGPDAPAIDGWRKYLEAVDPVIVDSRRNDVEVTRELLLETGDPWRTLLCTCKTGRLFALLVPKEMKTCADAQHWLSGDGHILLNMSEEVPTCNVIGRS